MSRLQIYILAAVYTALMAVIISIVEMVQAGAIVIAVAKVWFWMGRLSSSPKPDARAEISPKIKWGRQ